VTGLHVSVPFERALVVFFPQADIVAQTRIVYHEKELLQLIHDHLLKEGMFL